MAVKQQTRKPKPTSKAPEYDLTEVTKPVVSKNLKHPLQVVPKTISKNSNAQRIVMSRPCGFCSYGESHEYCAREIYWYDKCWICPCKDKSHDQEEGQAAS